jgi:hypothetical protein
MRSKHSGGLGSTASYHEVDVQSGRERELSESVFELPTDKTHTIRCETSVNSNTYQSEIWIENTTSGERKLVAAGYYPFLTPDGLSIIYDGGYRRRGLWIVNIDGTNDHRVLQASGTLQWGRLHSHGSKLVVLELTFNSGHHGILWEIDLETEKVERVADLD